MGTLPGTKHIPKTVITDVNSKKVKHFYTTTYRENQTAADYNSKWHIDQH